MIQLRLFTRKQAWISLILTAVCLAGCSWHTSIGDINRDPSRFTGKEITIRGQVSDSVGLLRAGVFQLDDGTGSIWVFSQDFGIPAKDTKVSVTGQVQQGFTFAGKNYGVIFRQTKARD